jgi:hypothetical protein
MMKTMSMLCFALISFATFAASDVQNDLKELLNLEKTLPTISNKNKKFHHLEEIAQLYSSDTIKMTPENLDRAKLQAEELLGLTGRFKKDWSYGNAIHHGNLVLGRIALFNNDLKNAEKYLALAGSTPGSPQLNSFGPNMTLAKEILEKGGSKSVISYIDSCLNFWKGDDDVISTANSWKQSIALKSIPNFYAHLIY